MIIAAPDLEQKIINKLLEDKRGFAKQLITEMVDNTELWVSPRDATIRNRLFAGHDIVWIRQFIFDRFPEISIQEGGWLKDAHGRGKRTMIYLPKAEEWIREHVDEIDWEEQLPRRKVK